MRGYKILRKSGRMPLLVNIKNSICTEEISNFSISGSGYLQLNAVNSAELLLRRYLMLRIGDIGLNKSVLAAVGGGLAIHIVPPYALKFLSNEGVPVNHFLSKLAWLIYTVLTWGHGCLTIFNILISSLPKRGNKTHNFQTTAYFMSITDGNLPTNISGTSFDLISWYSTWPERNKKIVGIQHSLSSYNIDVVNGLALSGNSNLITGFKRYFSWLKFVLWSILAIFRSLFYLLCGKWWHPLLLGEASKAKYFDLQDADQIAGEYWFQHAGYIYRPIWTYKAEEKGSRIFLYFYSINNTWIQPHKSMYLTSKTWSLLDWPNYIVWGELQQNFIKEFTSPSHSIYKVPDLPFVDCPVELSAIPGFKIAVFDVQPRRPYIHATVAQPYEYYSPALSKKFILDIQEIANHTKATVLWKQKRKIGKYAHPEYTAITKKHLKSDANFKFIEEKIAAHRIAKDCDVVINMAYTSTAIIAKNYGKPSYYYDPDGVLNPFDIQAQGIPIIQSKIELLNTINSLKNSN